MGKEFCAFCGEKIGVFGGEPILCAGVYQPCCKTCSREVSGLSREELCRRALQSGRAACPDRLSSWLTMVQNSEDHRPLCQYCGGKLTFRKAVVIHNMARTAFSEQLVAACPLRPAACPQCGRMEFFDFAFVDQDETLSYLAKKDTGET